MREKTLSETETIIESSLFSVLLPLPHSNLSTLVPIACPAFWISLLILIPPADAASPARHHHAALNSFLTLKCK